MRNMTDRQTEILEFIYQHATEHGLPPTRAEIAKHFGFRSPNAAEMHVQALARKNMLEITPNASRALRLTESGLTAIGQTAEMSTDASEKVRAQVTKQLEKQYQSKLAEELQQKAQDLADKFGEMLNLPLVGRVAAGSPILAQEHVERSYQVDANMFGGKADYLLKVRGMSMRDVGILDGDLLAVRRTTEARNGQIIVARVGEDVTVKRLNKQGHKVELIAENPDYAPIIVDLREEAFRIEGIAVGLIRPDGIH